MKPSIPCVLPIAALVSMLLASCLPQQADGGAGQPPVALYHGFGNPQRVTIRGYEGDAMEPFITKDGKYLLFNNRNDPRTDTNLHFASRLDDLTFQYRGELKGANTPALDAVPSVDRDGNLYFVSVRSYASTLSTLYHGRFNNGTVSGVELVDGISPRKPGVVNFDAEISADGKTLVFVDGLFTGGSLPKSADIAIAVRDGQGFRRLASGADPLRNVNTLGLEYAPAISSDLLELFFTRVPAGSRSLQPLIMRTARLTTNEPFGPPERVATITGFVEAPTLTADGQALYFHKLDDDRYGLFRVSR